MTLFLRLTRVICPAPTSERSRKPVTLGSELRILKPNSASTYVTTSRCASSKVRKRLEFENQVVLKLLWYHCLQTSQLDLVVHLILQHSRLVFQKKASSRRNDSAKKVSLPSSCCSVVSLLQSSPCLQWVIRRVGNNVVSPRNS